jgi:hypothetical protein
MRPLHDLVISSGALVLGVWGIRALLTPGTAYRTIVDLALSAIILFLLGAITVRALQFCYARSDLRRKPAKAEAVVEAKAAGNECDQPDCTNPIAYRCATCRQAFCPRHGDTAPVPRCDTCAAAESAGAAERAANGSGAGSGAIPAVAPEPGPKRG